MLKWTKQQQKLRSQQNITQKIVISALNNPKIRHSLAAENSSTNSTIIKKSQKLSKLHKQINSQETSTTAALPMPTVTHTLERRLHRRSLDNQLDDATPQQRRCRERHSLTSQANKENFGVHFMRSPCGNTSLTALHDLSNGKSVTRLRDTPPRTPRRRTLSSLDTPINIRCSSEATPSPLRHAAGRFSDDFAEANDESPLSRMRFRQTLRDEVSLTSSRMGDTTLDRMLDAIIESARKDVKCAKHQQAVEQPSTHVADAMQCVENFNESIHEMEVRTPTHLKRQRVVRRKKTASAVTAKAKATLERERSPLTPQLKSTTSIGKQALLAMDTPQHVPCVSVDPPNFGKDLQRCSTPTLEETQSIKRCLSFSPPSDEDIVDDADYSAAKRSSVASSNASSMGEAHFSPTLGGRTSQRSSLKMLGGVKGALDLAIFVEQEVLNVHVIRCRELQRSNGSTVLNAYVKVALIGVQRSGNAAEQRFQRTAVHRHSSRPYFDHCFKFDLGSAKSADASNTVATCLAAAKERLQLAVWHRDRQLNCALDGISVTKRKLRANKVKHNTPDTKR